MNQIFVKTLFLCMGLLLLQAQNVVAQNVNIDLSKEYQVIRGFGGIHINSWTGQQINDDMQEKAFDNDPGEMGLSIFRMPIDPNSGSWNDELPIAKYALSKGAIVFASPWNPPSNMRKELGVTNDGTDYVLLPEYYNDYVGHLNSFIEHMDNNGVPLYAVSIQNEPDWHSWTTWTAPQMLTFVKENAQHINCRVIAPESFSYSRKMIDPLLNDSIANSHIDILGTHLYGTSKSNFYYPLAYEKGKEIWMTEHLYGSDKPESNTWGLAMEIAEEINTCMDANMSAFVYWYIRRFYGLIDDLGNITDKGYVLSHFSKFIRPGAHRVQTNFNPSTKVSTTAFKTDSTVVIVVVNSNNKAVDLQFNIENMLTDVDSLTQFTSTASKKVLNDGTIFIEAGNFSASVDANSITTFTSNPSQGGKYGNIKPVALAGGSCEVFDSLGTGINITLMGSESTDADGEIVKYSWAQNGYQISTLPNLNVDLIIGDYTFLLTVTDNDGATDTDTVNVSVYNNNTIELWLEAECTQVGDNWDILADNKASNGKYLSVKPGIQSNDGPSADVADHLVYNFHLAESGSYKIWARVLAPSPNDDSYWVKVDDADWVMWNGIVGSSTWGWDDVHNGSSTNPMVYALDTGYHVLSVCFREDGAAIDKFFIANTGKIPTGMGSNASNCDPVVNAVPNNCQLPKINVYPNPAQTNLSIESSGVFSQIEVFNTNGQRLMFHCFKPTHFVDIPICLENGFYILQVSNSENSIITKFIVKQ